MIPVIVSAACSPSPRTAASMKSATGSGLKAA
jgi:threonine/homoserine/homoserine lactone efflux protein